MILQASSGANAASSLRNLHVNIYANVAAHRQSAFKTRHLSLMLFRVAMRALRLLTGASMRSAPGTLPTFHHYLYIDQAFGTASRTQSICEAQCRWRAPLIVTRLGGPVVPSGIQRRRRSPLLRYGIRQFQLSILARQYSCSCHPRWRQGNNFEVPGGRFDVGRLFLLFNQSLSGCEKRFDANGEDLHSKRRRSCSFSCRNVPTGRRQRRMQSPQPRADTDSPAYVFVKSAPAQSEPHSWRT